MEVKSNIHKQVNLMLQNILIKDSLNIVLARVYDSMHTCKYGTCLNVLNWILAFVGDHLLQIIVAFLPSIIKIFQRVFDLQSGHEINGLSLSNITKGDNSKSKKARVVILVHE